MTMLFVQYVAYAFITLGLFTMTKVLRVPLLGFGSVFLVFSYTYALSTLRFSIAPLVATLFALCAVALLTYLFLLVYRHRPTRFALFSYILSGVMISAVLNAAWLGSSVGIPNVPEFTTPLPISIGALLLLVLHVIFVGFVYRLRFFLLLQAVGENAAYVEQLGYDVKKIFSGAFYFSVFLMAVGYSLLVGATGFVVPYQFAFENVLVFYLLALFVHRLQLWWVYLVPCAYIVLDYGLRILELYGYVTAEYATIFYSLAIVAVAIFLARKEYA